MASDRRKYAALLSEFELVRGDVNERLKTTPRTSQAWKAFKQMRYELYGTKSRTRGFKAMEYPRSRKQAEQMERILHEMRKFTTYKSSTEEGRTKTEELKKKSFEANPHEMDFDEFMDWLKSVSSLSYLAAFDSNLVVRYGGILKEAFETTDDVKKYIDDLVKTARGEIKDTLGIKRFNALLRKEKDMRIGEKIATYIEKQFPDLFYDDTDLFSSDNDDDWDNW